MTATSRFVRYAVAGSSYITSALAGERGVSRGTDNVSDVFTIPGGANNQIRVNVDSIGAQQITLSSGTSLEARFVASDLSRKVQAFSALGDGFKWFTCDFTNYKSGDGESHFVGKSGSTGASSAVVFSAGDSDASAILGLSSTTAEAGTTYHTGTTTANTYAGTITVSGTYGGMLDEEYYVVCGKDVLSTIAAGAGNTYAGTASLGGFWDNDSASTYVVTIDASGGKEVMNAGTGTVPTFTVNDTGVANDDVAVAQEILYSDYMYYVGTKGILVKWTDAQFGNGDTFTVTCTPATDAGGGGATGAVGVAKVVWTSSRGDNAASATTTSTSYVDIGTKGVQMKWTASDLTVKDAWRILCRAPTPEAYNVTSMSYGNVTVTTNSAVKVHQFELMSGARVLSNVKFSLNSHGTFSHHDAGNDDTYFHFGTVGAGNRGDGSGPVAATGVEWKSGITATDISTDKTGGATGLPTNLWAAKNNLSVVADADSAETVGNYGLQSDYVFTAIKLGSSETGSNSSIVMRYFYDYS